MSEVPNRSQIRQENIARAREKKNRKQPSEELDSLVKNHRKEKICLSKTLVAESNPNYGQIQLITPMAY